MMDYLTLGVWVLVFEGFVGIIIKIVQLCLIETFK